MKDQTLFSLFLLLRSFFFTSLSLSLLIMHFVHVIQCSTIKMKWHDMFRLASLFYGRMLNSICFCRNETDGAVFLFSCDALMLLFRVLMNFLEVFSKIVFSNAIGGRWFDLSCGQLLLFFSIKLIK